MYGNILYAAAESNITVKYSIRTMTLLRMDMSNGDRQCINIARKLPKKSNTGDTPLLAVPAALGGPFGLS